MENLILVETAEALKKLQDILKVEEFIAFDCETTGLDRDAEIVGYSVCCNVDEAYYVVIAKWDVEQQALVYLKTKEGTKSFLSSLVGKKLIMHNAVFDCSKVEANFGVSLIESLHTDTMLLAHVLDENRHVGLKELGADIFGQDAKKEQGEMKESVAKNGGMLTKKNYEMYKADYSLLGRYGAKDTLLTLKLFYHLVPQLFDQGLDKFFYEDETMPLLKGSTYQLNTSGLRIDFAALEKLRKDLETECLEAKAFIYSEITPIVKDLYPGTKKSNTFNIGASKQLSWLLFFRLGNEFSTLTKGGKEVCKALGLKTPYYFKAKQEFIAACNANKGTVVMGKKIRDPWQYIASGKDVLKPLAAKYKWVEKLLAYSKNLKLLNTYVTGIQERAKYNTVYPSFLQHGTTSGRYSSRNPNFQNLPRSDKRIKSCIVARPGKVFVGSDYSQLEPRVFASFSNDERLIKCFKDGDDFYSVIGVEVFDKFECSLKKDDENGFAKKFPDLRDVSKVVALSSTYGTTAFKMAPAIGKSVEEASEIIDNYFERFPFIQSFMLSCHEKVKTEGQVKNLFGRPRRLPEGLNIPKVYGKTDHADLPYAIRNILNLSVNHVIQSTGASIMNRAAIALNNKCRQLANTNVLWNQVKIVMQIHDEIVLEGPEELANEIAAVLKDSMENTVTLPNVALIAEPKIGKTLSELK